MTEPIDMPEFAFALRGYDREQVDAYVRRLQSFLVDAERRARDAELAAAQAASPDGYLPPTDVELRLRRVKDLLMAAVEAATTSPVEPPAGSGRRA